MKANETKPDEITSVHRGNSISAIACNFKGPKVPEGPVIMLKSKPLALRKSDDEST